MSKLEERMAFYLVMGIWVHITRDTILLLIAGLLLAWLFATLTVSR